MVIKGDTEEVLSRLDNISINATMLGMCLRRLRDLKDFKHNITSIGWLLEIKEDIDRLIEDE